MSKNNGSYYSHIDSLRAIAVFTVILFHINHDYLPGGFVGVDIFFVISGFLISSQLFKSVSNNTFSIKDFYARRIKRILPAAFSVIFITVLIAQFLFLPEDAKEVADSGIWSAFSLSNVYFWKFQDTSYFAAGSYTTPLLHYWSLGVEEQFYIFWPIIVLVLLPRLNKFILIALLIITIITSATIAQFMLKEHHSFVYYMLPTRAGELLVGALLAGLLHFNIIKKPKYSSPLFIVAIIGIVASCLFITSDMIFPGWLYLVPTVFAALFIWSGFNQTSSIAEWLSASPVLWLGKVSYSAYLVHWPLLAFYRYGYGEPTPFTSILLFISILLLSWLNWKYVEERFRYVNFSFRQLTIQQFILPSLAIILISGFVIKTNGFGVRSDNYQIKFKELTNEAKATNQYNYICQYWRLEEKHFTDIDCVVGDNKETDILLWGDSNAAHYIGLIGSIAKNKKWSFRNISHASCPPIFNDVQPFVKVDRYDDCQSSIDLVRSKLDQYQTIIISAAYDYYARKSPSFMAYFEQTIAALVESNHQVIIIGKAPVYRDFDRHCLAKSIIYPWKSCSELEQYNRLEIDAINTRLLTFSKTQPHVRYIDFNEELCEGSCSPYKDGMPIYFDPSHIEIQSSWRLGKHIIENNKIPTLFETLISTRE
ncbi:acyltransferase family protein [Colwellia sp. BRX9-1]|uniref:acyltransferase family protein n=1 Tax=Colwellia sp. BRX9-1 TaxID=2759830 RepID=UPI0015F5CDF5|nr:acyltransferase family protein [Colwellia sp. BRX9-1]MBA6352877.1 acyltransferase [Colwellia sp. BRX9-1]